MNRRSALKIIGGIGAGLAVPGVSSAGLLKLITGDIPKYEDYKKPSREFVQSVFAKNSSENLELYLRMPKNSFDLDIIIFEQVPITATGYFKILKTPEQTSLEMRLKAYEIENPNNFLENKQIILSQRNHPNQKGEKLYREQEYDFVLDKNNNLVGKKKYNEPYIVSYPTIIDLVNCFFDGIIQSSGVQFAGKEKIMKRYNLQVSKEKRVAPYDAVFCGKIINNKPKINNIQVFCYQIEGVFFPAEIWADFKLNMPTKPWAKLKSVITNNYYTKND